MIMIIEPYTDNRREEVIRLVRDFHQEALAGFGQRLDVEVLLSSIDKLRTHSFLLIVGSECVGLLAGAEIPPLIGFNKIYQEVIWYVDRKYRSKGVYLLKYAIKTLKEDGFSHIVMTALANSKTEKIGVFLKKLGFIPLEIQFIKEL